jgi:hypothetical protein
MASKFELVTMFILGGAVLDRHLAGPKPLHGRSG